MKDLTELKAELRYCLDNGMYGQRTGLALQWALEIVECNGALGFFDVPLGVAQMCALGIA